MLVEKQEEMEIQDMQTLILVLKEIIFQQFSASYDVSEKYITPQDFLSWGVFL